MRHPRDRLRTDFLTRRQYMTTLGARWEKPDYTGVIAEVPLGHVLHPKNPSPYPSRPELCLTIAWFLVVFDLGKCSQYGRPSLCTLIAGISSVTPFIPANLLLGGLLPDVWNVSVWETCKVFCKKPKIIFAWKAGGLARFSSA